MALRSSHYHAAGSGYGLSAFVSRALSRVLGVFTEWNSTASDREIARFIQRSGGRLTDAVEREIADRATTSGFGR